MVWFTFGQMPVCLKYISETLQKSAKAVHINFRFCLDIFEPDAGALSSLFVCNPFRHINYPKNKNT